MTKAVNIHASCVVVNGKGILLLGPSGAGKSDLALQLIDGGAKLLADDRCELFGRAEKLCARPPGTIAGLIELRGIGIVALPHARQAPIALAVRLSNREALRLPTPRFYALPAALGPLDQVPEILVNPRHASAPAKIRAALAAFVGDGFRDTFNTGHRGNIRL